MGGVAGSAGGIAGGLAGTAIGGPVGGIIGGGLGSLAGGALGGASAPSSYSYGGSPQTYIPTAQPGADIAYQQGVGFGAGAGGGLGVPASQFPQTNPAYTAYQTGLGLYGQTPNATNYLFDPNTANQYTQGATNAANYFANTAWPAVSGAPTALAGQSYNLYNQLAPTLMANATNPMYGNLVNQAANNPYYAQALSGAQTGAGIGGAAAGQAGAGSAFVNQLAPQIAAQGQQYGNLIAGMAPGLYGQGQQYSNLISGLAPQATGYGSAAASTAPALQAQGFGIGGAIANAAQPLQGASNAILQSGFDPQSALFNQLQGQVLNQSQAANAAAGVGSSPYGASVTSNALGNFDINWQNNLLQRQTQALQSAGANQNTISQILAQGGASNAALQQAAANLYNTGIGGTTAAGGLYNQGFGAANTGTTGAAGLYGSGFGTGLSGATGASGLFGQGLSLGQGGAGLATTAAGAPSSVYQQNLSSILPYLQAQQAAGTQGVEGMGGLIGAESSGLSNAYTLGTGLTNAINAAGAMPYQANQTIGGNYLNTLGGLNTLNQNVGQTGMGAFTLPQQYLNYMLPYMQLGQAAQSAGLAGGQMGQQELASGLGGMIGGANALFNPNFGLFGSGLGGGANSLVGNTYDPAASGDQLFGGGIGDASANVGTLGGGGFSLFNPSSWFGG